MGGLLILGRIILSSLTRDLLERVYISKGPPNPNSQTRIQALKP